MEDVSTDDDLIKKLLYMSITIIVIFAIIFFIIPALAHMLSISY